MRSKIKYKSNTMDMLSGSLSKKILIFSIPLIASRLLQLLFKTADIVVIGRFAGKESLAAVGACGPLVDLLVGFFSFYPMVYDEDGNFAGYDWRTESDVILISHWK